MASKTQSIARRRTTKQEADHSAWMMGKLFDFMKIRREMRRRKHKLPETLVAAVDKLDAEMTTEFIRLISVAR
ncbi:hypothetical protein UFOVP466_35 [uncultured Caudovirales phage]|uniref:Uncharacterized protein n=1 Tax=uncultured Caudovirales phage TaxID=2100421 RepID=A0A6J5R0F5_9CAUD|nr:hypothetical protein UFOVP466_35 [uncultured Caudovirales phage]CAB4180694.1 hypothetical protein UFOVP1045_82 [uncultured Caudovirales phage]CAB4190133.1 hypothetical protein UFOVP1194_36 [uncultured Caudovirales phage]CAB4221795.1 hypothetical protein UFOVP1641_32 [uncultured Caudovirales phage]